MAVTISHHREIEHVKEMLWQASGSQAAFLVAHHELTLDFLSNQQQCILDLFERFDRKKNGS
jgi:hypothetical protein